MDKLYLLIVGILLSLHSFAQHNTVLDSLLSKLEEANEDTIKVEILLRLFNPTVINNLELANKYTEEALHLSEYLIYDKGIAAAYQRKGIYWGYKGNIAKARESYIKSIEVHKRLRHPVVAATLIHNLGLLYQEQGIYDSAIIYGEKAANIFLQYKDSLKYASSLDLLSSIHEEQGNYFLSLKFATEAAGLFHKYGDKLREADAMVKIGTGYTLNRQYQLAIDYYQSAINLYKIFNDRYWENFAQQKIANAYIAMDNIFKADSVIDYSLLLSDSLGTVQMLSEGYDIKGDIFFKKGNYNMAKEYYQKALDTNKDAVDSTFIATAVISIGRCHQQMGKMDLALLAYLEVLPISERMDVKENLTTIYQHISQIYEHKGENSLALRYYKKYKNIKDIIYANERTRQFADMQAKYDAERKEREIAIQNQTITILQQKAEIQELVRLRLIVSIAVVILLCSLSIYTFWLYTKKNKLKQEMERERLIYELDMKKRELTTRTLLIIQKNELMETLQNKVKSLQNKAQHNGASFTEISNLIRTNRLIDKDWDNFKSVFEQVHPDFFSKLKSLYATISPNELRMSAMMKMNLNTKEMASILNITPDSVKKARYRMRKKFDLVAELSVQDYLMSLK